MRPLSASALLQVYERGHGQAPVRRALLLLETACANESFDTLAALPVGRRDERLLTLRAQTLGGHFNSEATCPACAERLEFGFDVADVRARSGDEAPDIRSLHCKGYEVTFRLPNSADLMALARPDESLPDALALLERCLVEVHPDDGTEDVRAAHLPAPLIEAITAEMAEADPQADPWLSLTCPGCGHTWKEAFNIGTYFWREIETHAARLFEEVHQLAGAYGWPESDILAMNAWRRQQYLNRLNR